MLCLVTRLEAPNLLTFARAIISALLIRRQARAVAGLRETAVFLRRPHVVFIVSLWDSHDAITEFNTLVPAHVGSVTRFWQQGGRSWSCLFELVGPTPNSRYWPELTSGAVAAER